MNPLKTFRKILTHLEDSVPSPKLQSPTVLQFPINNICNSRCQMCDIWKQKRQEEISPQQIRAVLSSKLFRKLKHVGINGGEPTLRKDFSLVVSSIVESLPKLAGITLITNAINHRRVIEQAQLFAKICKESGVSSTVMISTDGVGSVHDAVRGRPGNFDSVTRVIDALKQTEDLDNLTLGCTLIKENARHAEELLGWAIKQGIYIRFRLGIPHQRLYSNDGRNAFNLNEEDRFHIANFLDFLRLRYEQNPVRRLFYLSLRNQVAYSQPRTAGCPWRNRGATLLSNGDFAYCAVESPSLGSSIKTDPHELYWENNAVRESILADKCATCQHDYDGIKEYSNFRYIAKEGIRGILPRPILRLAENLQDRRWAAVNGRRLKEGILLPNTTTSVKNDNLPILICGWYGTETLGDKAILASIVRSLRHQYPQRSITLASIEPFVSRYTTYQMPEMGIEKIIDFETARASLESGAYSAVAIAGGPLMATVREIVDLAVFIASARRRGIPTAVLGSGIGPLGGKGPRDRTGRKAIISILENSDTIVTRDSASSKLARSLAPNCAKPQTMLDPAFLWTADVPESVPPIKGRYLLLCLREWQISEYAANLSPADAASIKRTFEESLLKCIDLYATQNPDIQIIPFCMHKREVGGDDRMFYQSLLKDRPELLANIDYQHRSPISDFRWFQHASAVLSMRFHSFVFALSSGSPCLTLDYTMGGKIAALASDLGLDESQVISIRELSPEKVAGELSKLSRTQKSDPTHLQSQIDQSRKTLQQAVRSLNRANLAQ